MMFTSVRELKAKTSEKLRKVEEEDEPMIVTVHGKPKAVIIPVDEDELEDLYYQYSPKFRKSIEEAQEDFKAGRFVSWDEVIAKSHKKKK